MPPLTQEDIYSWCEEGQKRYKKENPPGYKDAKTKDGVRQYSDLILWNEILRYAAKTEKNILFVTDDVKADWWETKDDTKQFHSTLCEEFQNKTGHKIMALVSHEFYDLVSRTYAVNRTDAVELALRMTDNDYCKKISDKVYHEVEYDLMYYATDYIDTTTAHIGSEGIDEFDITEYEFTSAERIGHDNETVTYHFNYHLILEGT